MFSATPAAAYVDAVTLITAADLNVWRANFPSCLDAINGGSYNILAGHTIDFPSGGGNWTVEAQFTASYLLAPAAGGSARSGIVATGDGNGWGGNFIGGATGNGAVCVANGAGNTIGVLGESNGTGPGVAGAGLSTGVGGLFTGGIGAHGVTGLGNGIGNGGDFTGGGTSGTGCHGTGGGPNGGGIAGTGTGAGPGVGGVGGATGPGGSFTAGGGNAVGVSGLGHGSGAGGSFAAGTSLDPAVLCLNGPLAFTGTQVAAGVDCGFDDALGPARIAKAWALVNISGAGATTILGNDNVDTATVVAGRGGASTGLQIHFARPLKDEGGGSNSFACSIIATELTAGALAYVPYVYARSKTSVTIGLYGVTPTGAAQGDVNFGDAIAKSVEVVIFGRQT